MTGTAPVRQRRARVPERDKFASDRVVRWYREVLACRLGRGEAKALLLHLALSMDKKGRVSIYREELAGRFDVHERRVTDWIKTAHDTDLLRTVRAAYPGHPAMYQATIPAEVANARLRSNTAVAGNPQGNPATNRRDHGGMRVGSRPRGTPQPQTETERELGRAAGSPNRHARPSSRQALPTPRAPKGRLESPNHKALAMQAFEPSLWASCSICGADLMSTGIGPTVCDDCTEKASASTAAARRVGDR